MGKKTRKTRKQVQKWASKNMPDSFEKYGEGLLDYLYPERAQRGWAIAVLVLMVAGVVGGVATAIATARDTDA